MLFDEQTFLINRTISNMSTQSSSLSLRTRQEVDLPERFLRSWWHAHCMSSMTCSVYVIVNPVGKRGGCREAWLTVYVKSWCAVSMWVVSWYRLLFEGISQAVRPSCTDTASTDPCAIQIRHRVVPTDPRSSYGQWSAGDLHLDWYGPQSGQGTYQGTAAGGTPLMWTTSKLV